MRERDNPQDPGVDGIIIVRYSGNEMGGMDWINLVQDRDRWRALVSEVMNLLFP
jgi:hypothetical protein